MVIIQVFKVVIRLSHLEANEKVRCPAQWNYVDAKTMTRLIDEYMGTEWPS
jgi:hypothetical protein